VLPARFRFALTLILISRGLAAYGQSTPKPLRFDLTPLAGYRTNINFTGEPTDEGVTPRVVLDSGPSYGIAFGARLKDEDLIEFRWARQNTHLRFFLEDGFLPDFRQAVTVDQFHGDFTHEYIVDDWPTSIRPFIMASVGVTHVNGSIAGSFTRFSFGLGTGIKFFLNRRFGFRVQGEWLPVVIDPQVLLACGGGCLVRIRGQLSSQGEFAIGPTLRF
jgi:hypothetical protein